MSKLTKLICGGATTEEIKANLWDNRHNKDYVNIVDEYGRTALICACLNNKIEVVKLLLNANTDVNIVAEDGRSALMWACAYGRTEIVKLLLEVNADVNFVDEDGYTALMISCYNNNIEAVKLLLEANADVNIVNKDGMTALKIAEKYKRTGIIELLNNWDNHVMLNGKKYKLIEVK